MLKAILIDDVEHVRHSLAGDIAVYCPDVVIIGEASSVATAVPLITRMKPDLVFLDIQLGDGTGFDVLERMGKRDFKVVFTTGLDTFGIKAIKFGALDYLLKPVDPDDLVAAVEKAKDSLAAVSVGDRVEVALETLRHSSRDSTQRIALSTADRVYIVALREIIRCESQRNYTVFHLTGSRQILVTRTLKEFDEMLDGLGFFRAHHSHLVNVAHIREYVKLDGGYVVMDDGSEVTVAVRKKEALLHMLGV